MKGAEDLAGSHSLARAQRDWPIRERLLTIAAEQSEPILREALVDLTADNLEASLGDELSAAILALEGEESTEAAAHLPEGHRRDYQEYFGPLRDELVRELRVDLQTQGDGPVADVVHDLAREFSGVFWSGMLTHMRCKAVDGHVDAWYLVDALQAKPQTESVGPRPCLADVAKEFGMTHRRLGVVGLRILIAVLRDTQLQKDLDDAGELRFPLGLRVNREDLERELKLLEYKHMFDGRPIVDPSLIAGYGSDPNP